MRKFLVQITAVSSISFILFGAQDSRSNENNQINYASQHEGATVVYKETSSTYFANKSVIDNFRANFCSIFQRIFGNFAIFNYPTSAISENNGAGNCFAAQPKRNKNNEITEPAYLTIMLKKDILIENIAIRHRQTMPFKRESMPKDIIVYRIDESDPSKINESTKKTKIGHCFYDADLNQEVQNCVLNENATDGASRIIQFEIISSYGNGNICLYQVIVEGEEAVTIYHRESAYSADEKRDL